MTKGSHKILFESLQPIEPTHIDDCCFMAPPGGGGIVIFGPEGNISNGINEFSVPDSFPLVTSAYPTSRNNSTDRGTVHNAHNPIVAPHRLQSKTIELGSFVHC